jgi:tetratricopeptide (TPR) repeat protein
LENRLTLDFNNTAALTTNTNDMIEYLKKYTDSIVIIICLIVLSGLCCLGQDYNKKSLLDSLQSATDPETRVRLLWNLADELQRYDLDSSLILSHQAIVIGRAINYKEGLSRSYGIIGNVYSRMNDFPKALEYYFSKQKIDEQSGNARNLASTLINIGVVFSLQTDFKEALAYFEKADSISHKNNLTEMYYHLDINLGNVYEKLKQADRAAIFYNKALNSALMKGDSLNMALAHIGLANVYSMKGDEFKALNNYDLAIPVIKESKDMEMYSEALLGKAKIYFEFGDNVNALTDALKSYREAKAIESFLKMYESSDFISGLYQKQQAYDSAFAYLKLSKMYGDSLNNLSRLKNIQALTVNEKIRQNEIAEYKKLEHERAKFRLQVILVTVFIPMLFLVSIILSKRRIKHSVIKFLGVVSLMFAFEFITLLLHPLVENISGHNLFIEVFIFVIIGFILVPAHHRIEKTIIRILINNRIQLELSKKEPDQ